MGIVRNKAGSAGAFIVPNGFQTGGHFMMRLKQIAGVAMLAAGLAFASGAAWAQDAAKKPHVPGAKAIGQAGGSPIPSLAVLNSRGATLEGGKLTLVGVAPNTIVFSDRPARMAGHVNTAHFISQWDEGRDSFAKDPPNATISVLDADGTTVDDAVVVLKSPKIEGENLTFDVSVLEGSLVGAKGSAALFIDWFAAHGGGWHGGGWHGGGWHGGWYHGGYGWHVPGAFYAGAAVGAVAGAAAASQPYYPPPCGYYPYPPCY
jgi:hypothetical protein